MTTEKLTKHEEKIKGLYRRGVTDPRTIAKKLGHTGASITAAVGKINDTFVKLGFKTGVDSQC